MPEARFTDGTQNYYDLTTTYGDTASIDGALFQTSPAEGSAGTGLIQAFVRVQSDGTEEGYNTDARPLEYDENSSPSFTTSLLLSSVPVIEIEGVLYYEFRLDINQTNNNPYLSLNELKLFKGTDPEPEGAITDATFTSVTELVWDLDDQNLDGSDDTDNTVLMDYSLQAGSGRSDAFFYVPVTDFGGADPATTYVTLYSEFGTTGELGDNETLVSDDGQGFDASVLYGDYSSNDGFEEWSVSKDLGDTYISGFKWEDLDGDGVWDSGEPGIGGWKFDFSYTVGNGNNAETITASVTTSDGMTDVDGDGIADPLGYYAIPVMSNGNQNYIVTISEAFNPLYWINTYDGDATVNGSTTVTIQGDLTNLPNGDFEVTEKMNFGNFRLFEISGTKYTDITGDGISADDTPLGGITIFIDANGNGLNDDGYSAVTAADGTWSIGGLTAAVDGALVKEITPQGWVQTIGPVDTIDATSGNDQGGFDFANFELFSISGIKFEDRTGDGISADDGRLEGFTFWVDLNDDGDLDADEPFAVSAADGTWTIENLDWSVANAPVKELSKDGFVQTVGQVGTVLVTNYTVDATSGNDQTGFNFANFEEYDVYGFKWVDTDGDGVWDADESAKAGWKVYLDDGAGGVMEATTDALGQYTFSGLGPGDYSVYEDESDTDWTQTYNGATTFSGISGEDQGGRSGYAEAFNFGNFELFDLWGYKWEDSNGNGLWDEGETALADWTIYLDDGQGGVTSYQTDATGKYTITDLGPGSYSVYEDMSDTNWKNTWNGALTFSGKSGMDLGGAYGIAEDFNFGNYLTFSISGHKYEDLTGNGIDDKDPGLANFRIFIDLNGDGEWQAGEPFDITDATGAWQINGLDWTMADKEVLEEAQDGWVMTVGQDGAVTVTDYVLAAASGEDIEDLDFANFELFEVSGTKYVDTNGNGLIDDGEPVRGGVTIFVDINGNGLNDDGFSATTAADGTWAIGGLDWTAHGALVKEITEDGWVQTLGPVDTIVGTSGNDQGGYDFGNFELFDLSGYKWVDSNGDGVWDEGEAAKSGWTIYLDVDLTGDGIFDTTVSTLTGVDGSYTFENLGPHKFRVREDMSNADWTNTSDGTVIFYGISGGGSLGGVEGQAGDFNFGNFQLFDISGTKYEDVDGDGVVEAGEGTLAGVQIFIDANENGSYDVGERTTTTDVNGDWSFANLDYSYAGLMVYEVAPDGSVATYGAAGYAITGTSGTDQTGLDFANFYNMSLSGYKWGDYDQSGTWNESTDAVLEGWTIVLDNDDDPTNGWIEAQVTDANGHYEFTGLNPVDYADIGSDADGVLYVYELLQDGFTQTYGGYSFAIESGLTIEGDLGETEDGNFGNYMMAGANRTPGFWQSTLGLSFYDGDPTNDGDSNGPKKGGEHDAEAKEAEGWTQTDLLIKYGIDTDDDGINDHFWVFDDGDDGWGTEGAFDDGDILLTKDQLYSWVSGGEKGGGRDYLQILERDMGAAFLNTLNNHSLTTPEIDDMEGVYIPVDSGIADSYEIAADFILQYDPDFDGTANEGKKAQQGDWDSGGSAAHNELGAFNESGDVYSGAATLTQVLMDGDDYSGPLVQSYLASLAQEAEHDPSLAMRLYSFADSNLVI